MIINETRIDLFDLNDQLYFWTGTYVERNILKDTFKSYEDFLAYVCCTITKYIESHGRDMIYKILRITILLSALLTIF